MDGQSVPEPNAVGGVSDMTAERAEFSNTTKQTIAGRAGYRCSFPDCDRVTIGPGAASNQIASVGCACHIYSASPGGPREQGGLSLEQLVGAENGFWACENHAKLVDTNLGKRYSAGLLLSWRELHEARIHREMGGVKLPVNWVERLDIIRSASGPKKRPLFAPGQHLTLSRVTLLIGDNGSGKTALCEWLKGPDDEAALNRWKRTDFSVALTVHNPDRHVFVTENLGQQTVFRLDGETVPFNPLPLVITSLSSRLRSPLRDEQTDVDWMAGCLDVSSKVLRRLIHNIEANGRPF